MSDSESSALSSPPPTDDESPPPIPSKPPKQPKSKISSFFKKKRRTPSQSPEPERPPSPPHDYVLADKSDITVIVMFRNRFAEAFPRSCPNIGPQDIENGIVGSEASDQVESLLCALLGLVLNRKKDVEKGHYGRALEDALSSQKHQWPLSWNGVNPLAGSKTFNSMNPSERLNFLRTLVHWALNSSEVISATIKESYKQTRHEDDINQPLSVQPWGMDDKKRRYWLVEGHNDTPFRIYRSNAKREENQHWYSVAGSIDEAKMLSDQIKASNKTQAAIRFAKAITNAVPRLEDTREKRKRKEYRQNRKAAFARPESGISLYEGRTRGKRARYTFDDDDDYGSDSSVRKSVRNNSGTATPVDGPTMTSSGRQIRSRFGKSYGDVYDSRNPSEAPSTDDPDSRPRRSARAKGGAQASRSREMYSGDSQDELDDEEEGQENGWSGDDHDVTGKFDDEDDEDDELSDPDDDDEDLDELTPNSKVVVLKYPKGADVTAKPVPSRPKATATPSTSSVELNGTIKLEPAVDSPLAARNTASSINGNSTAAALSSGSTLNFTPQTSQDETVTVLRHPVSSAPTLPTPPAQPVKDHDQHAEQMSNQQSSLHPNDKATTSASKAPASPFAYPQPIASSYSVLQAP